MMKKQNKDFEKTRKWSIFIIAVSIVAFCLLFVFIVFKYESQPNIVERIKVLSPNDIQAVEIYLYNEDDAWADGLYHNRSKTRIAKYSGIKSIIKFLSFFDSCKPHKWNHYGSIGEYYILIVLRNDFIWLHVEVSDRYPETAWIWIDGIEGVLVPGLLKWIKKMSVKENKKSIF